MRTYLVSLFCSSNLHWFTQIPPGATPFPALQQENRAPYAGARESKHPTHTQTIHPSSSSSSPRLKCHVTSPLVSIPQTDPSTYVSSGPVISEIPNVARPNLSTGSRSVQNHHLPGEGEELKNSPRATVPREEATTSSEMAPSSNPVMRHHSDSEIRLPPAVVDVPPAYSEE